MCPRPPRYTRSDTLVPYPTLCRSPNYLRFKFRLIPKETLDRRKKSASRRLTSGEGDRLARIAKVFSFAMDIYKDKAKVREFLGRPHAMPDDKKIGRASGRERWGQ